MNKIVVTAIAAGTLALGAASASAKDWKTVRIASEGAYAPFNMVDPQGNLAGFEVDLARALCDEMKVKCVLVKQDWDGMIPGLLAKKYDAIMASMSVTEERKQKVDFSQPYYQTPARFVARKGANLTISAEGLKGKVIGVQRETIHDRFVTDNFGKVAEIKRYGSAEDARLDLVAGRIDLTIDDSAVLDDGFLNKPEGKDFEFTGPSFDDEKWFGVGTGVALRKEDKDLKAMFDKAIDAVLANGTYKKIMSKYFDFDISKKKNQS